MLVAIASPAIGESYSADDASLNLLFISTDPIDDGIGIQYISNLEKHAVQIGYLKGDTGEKFILGWVPKISCTEFGCANFGVNLTALNTSIIDSGLAPNKTHYGLEFEARLMFLYISQEFYEEGNYTGVGFSASFPF